jgi:two-component system, sensor histidine kinase PdtaS
VPFVRPSPRTSEGRASAADRSAGFRRRSTGAWALPTAVLVVLVGLTLGFWRAEVRVTPDPLSPAPRHVLWGGLAISVLMSAAVFQTLLHRARAQAQTLQHLDAIESLNAISTAIGAQLSAGTALDALSEAAHRLLRMDRAVIGMYDPEKRALEVVATAGSVPSDFPKTFRLPDLPASSHCLETNTALFEEDTRRPTRPYGTSAVQAFVARSLILIPLRLEGRPIGLLTMSSSEPREFTRLDRRIGELLGAQASVVLSNQRLYQTMRSALEASQRLLRQRQALSAAADIQSHGAVEGSLNQIVQLMPSVVGAEVCGVTLVTGPGLESVLAAVSPPYERIVGQRTGPNDLAFEAFATRRPLVVPNAHTDPRVHSSWQNVPGVGSILYMPMFRTDRGPLGILALARHQTGSFTQEQVELAQAFSSLAAVAVENARLLEQTRTDAAAKTMLLRELNHRVKNNLTGIVALLEVNRPAMDAQAGEWLNRATDRIRAMAGAHQLFTGGMERIPLTSLVAQTLAGCSASRPPGISAQTDLDEVKATLGPEQAVALAMVLNELCYNAMVHALRGGGSLTIRARGGTHDARGTEAAGAEDRVTIEVIDSGASEAPGRPAPADDANPEPLSAMTTPSGPVRPVNGTGFGLELVEGLVRRELHGTFELRPGEQGGTIAVVEFPLAPGELQP